jgi:hypothetical protein
MTEMRVGGMKGGLAEQRQPSANDREASNHEEAAGPFKDSSPICNSRETATCNQKQKAQKSYHLEWPS